MVHDAEDGGVYVYVKRSDVAEHEEPPMLGELAVAIVEQIIAQVGIAQASAASCEHDVRLDASCPRCEAIDTEESERAALDTEVHISRLLMDKTARAIVRKAQEIDRNAALN